MDAAVIPHGLTAVQIGRQIMWARRREKYGPSGHRPEARDRVLQGVRTMRALKLSKRTCKRGHFWSASNPRGPCRLCQTLRRHRAIRDASQRANLILRREAMIRLGIHMNQHPTSSRARWRFEAALRAYRAAQRAV